MVGHTIVLNQSVGFRHLHTTNDEMVNFAVALCRPGVVLERILLFNSKTFSYGISSCKSVLSYVLNAYVEVATDNTLSHVHQVLNLCKNLC